MAILNILYGPSPLFKEKAAPLGQIGAEEQQLASDMLETLYDYRGIGLAAPMVGISKRVIVVDLQQEGVRMPFIMFNPEITWRSKDETINEEASLSFPGISAEIKRPKSIKLTYQDKQGTQKELEASDWFATVIQHEMDYLEGRIYLDHLSKMKRDRLLKKMQKTVKQHQHQSSCGDQSCGHEHH